MEKALKILGKWASFSRGRWDGGGLQGKIIAIKDRVNSTVIFRRNNIGSFCSHIKIGEFLECQFKGVSNGAIGN